jgi:TM2 domain-containing membrane protein YozV
MPKNASVATLLSMLVPGLGQIYSGRGERGAAILIATIIVGNLNAIWLSLYAATGRRPKAFWANQLPRLLQDLFAAYGVIFWIWQVYDARRGTGCN